MTFLQKKKSCPLCGSDKIIQKYSIERWDYKFKIFGCDSCCFMFMNPPYSNDIQKEMYGEGYYSGSSDYRYGDERDFEKFSRYVWDARIKTIRKFVKEGNFLDVGCSFGGFLKAASSYFKAYGIEPSKYSGGYARSVFGERIHIGTLEDCPFEENYFSVITLVEVLEHIENPVKTIEKCYSLLTPGGLLLLQTANMDGWQAKNEGSSYHYFLPGHLSYFTEKNLVEALKNTGFSEVKSYIPVDFGVFPKLLKSRGNFKKLADYKKWFRVIYYHYKSMIKKEGYPLTSSMVLYALKKN